MPTSVSPILVPSSSQIVPLNVLDRPLVVLLELILCDHSRPPSVQSAYSLYNQFRSLGKKTKPIKRLTKKPNTNKILKDKIK
jgi:hypothetical protein